eukprot:jgi/Picre1/33586/NNA_001066.t1
MTSWRARWVLVLLVVASLLILQKIGMYLQVADVCQSARSPSVLVTGAAGFIGMHTVIKLFQYGYTVTGIDLFTDYYSIKLKKVRAKFIKEKTGIDVLKMDIANTDGVKRLFQMCGSFDFIIHLAAQPGVRFSVEFPQEAVEANIVKFTAFLESVVKFNQKRIRLIYASSSSVYGVTQKIPFEEGDKTDMPAAIYGATKKANELIAYSYHHLYNVSAIGLRFFTVYGPWGRPDMAVYTFARKIARKEQITINLNTDLVEFRRDFTYVDDITDGILSSIRYLNMSQKKVFEIFNLGTSDQHPVSDIIHALETHLKIKATTRKQIVEANGDVYATHASLDKSKRMLNYSNNYHLDDGIRSFCDWFMKYYKAALN